MKRLDLLVVGAHPDDAEIGAGGLMLSAKAAGLRVGVIDLTRGELGTRGTPELRAAESAAASALGRLDFRRNLDLGDGTLAASPCNRELLAGLIAELRPNTVVGHLPGDAHPDHNAAAELLVGAWHLAGIEKLLKRKAPHAKAHRPPRLLQFHGEGALLDTAPSLVVDIGAVFEAKLDMLRCYKSQLSPHGSLDRGEHFVSGTDILARSEINARYWGSRIGASHGEPFHHRGPLPTDAAWLLTP
jgi:bacillithiol biosynthesis deacetylase BshB1